jgi:predicted Zn-dependent protease
MDLYVPSLNFIFGLADRAFAGTLVGWRAVTALPRLCQSFYVLLEKQKLFLSRAVKEAVHEIGYT